MKRHKYTEYIYPFISLVSALVILMGTLSIASADDTTSYDSSGFISCVEGYDESIETAQLSREGVIQSYPYYSVNGDPYNTSQPEWRTIFSDAGVERYRVSDDGSLELHVKGGPDDADEKNVSPYLIDFNKTKSEFDALGEVSDVRIVFDFSISANLVFGTVNGKEYIVPFFIRPEWYEKYENGKAYPAEEIISLINETVQAGKEASQKAGMPVSGGGGIPDQNSFNTLVRKGIWPVAIVITAIVLVGVILILRKGRKNT